MHFLVGSFEHLSVPEKTVAKIKVKNKIINVTAVPEQKWRVYYWIRNDILRFTKMDKEKMHSILIRCPRKLLKTIIFRPEYILIAIKGYFHGLIGKKGKYIEP